MDRRLMIAIPAIAIVAILAATFITSNQDGPEKGDDESYEQKTVDAYLFGGTDGKKGSMDLRYYESRPNVPYAGLTDYYMKIQNVKMDVVQNGDGTFSIKNPKPNAANATIDLSKGTISSENYSQFTSISFDEAESDPLAPIVKEGDVETLAKASPSTIDFGKYGIKGHADESGKEIWLPLQTIADLFYNGANYYADYVGDAVYFSDVRNVMEGTYLSDEGYIDKAMDFIGMDKRPADLAGYVYDELCFLFDNFYGNPGKGLISADIAENGLDHALQSHGDDTRKLREFLGSTDAAEYLAAVTTLSSYVYDGGHTQTDLWAATFLLYFSKEGGLQFLNRIQAASDAMNPYSPPEKTYVVAELKNLRKNMLADATPIGTDAFYVSSGDTAIYTFNSFDQKAEAWEAYMADRKELPDDAIGNLFEALDMAKSDPSIKNFVIDLTTNQGGYLGVAGFIYSLMTGEDLVSEQLDTITGEVGKGSAICDINLDGKFDDADHTKLYDLNFGALTSTCTFSSGNYLPVMLKDAGVAILGERSGGGVCNLIQAATADGVIITTSGNSKMIVGYGEPGYDELKVEGGAEPDIKLTSEKSDGTTDYSNIYDLKLISEGMNSFYASA